MHIRIISFLLILISCTTNEDSKSALEKQHTGEIQYVTDTFSKFGFSIKHPDTWFKHEKNDSLCFYYDVNCNAKTMFCANVAITVLTSKVTTPIINYLDYYIDGYSRAYDSFKVVKTNRITDNQCETYVSYCSFSKKGDKFVEVLAAIRLPNTKVLMLTCDDFRNNNFPDQGRYVETFKKMFASVAPIRQ